MHYSDILWLNARNLLYIKPFNPKKNIRLANNKLKTKVFLEKREIPFPQTYLTITSRSKLEQASLEQLPYEDFVIKPTHWSKGKGILIVKKIIDEQWDILFHARWLSQWLSTEKDIKNYLWDILDGKYTIGNKPDSILIEEKLLPSQGFHHCCEWWLADIRLIVSNLVPVAAMVRIPTQASWGKANLAQWWIALGLDIATGKVISLYLNGKRHTTIFPEEYTHFKWMKIEFRNTVLTYSSHIQLYVNLWYLALDWVITEDGPKLLEINARAWLEIQNVCGFGLKQRLDRISKLAIKDPEKWVQVWKQLYSPSNQHISPDHILYLTQRGSLYLKQQRQVQKHDVTVEVDLSLAHNSASSDMFDIFQQWSTVLRCIPSESSFHSLVVQHNPDLPAWTVVLGSRDLKQYYIQPIRHTINTSIIRTWNNPLNLPSLDKLLWKLLLSMGSVLALRPVNIREEFDQFVKYNGSYNPNFKYIWYTDEKIEFLLKEIDYLDHALSMLKIAPSVHQLFADKLLELRYKALLHTAYKKQHFDDVAYYNQLLWGTINLKYLDQYNDIIMAPHTKHDEKIMLKVHDILRIIRTYLDSKGLTKIDVTMANDNFARISIRFWRKIKISVTPNMVIGYEELQRTLRHEIDVHIMRYLNGKDSRWKILQYWTGFYLQDEEWIATLLWQQWSSLPPSNSMYKKYYLVYKAQSMSFARLYELLRFFYPHRSFFPIFKGILRTKKWVIDTSVTSHGALFAKDLAYVPWMLKIEKRILNWWNIEDMMLWKIKTTDIEATRLLLSSSYSLK
jgi:alpha-L-glutamate ligase-like protein